MVKQQPSRSKKKTLIKVEKKDEDEVIVLEEKQIISPSKRKSVQDDDGGNKKNKRLKSDNEITSMESLFKYPNSKIMIETVAINSHYLSQENIQSLIKQSEQVNSADYSIDMYLRNFIDAINTIISRQEFAYLFNELDFDIIKKFVNLKIENKILYVRLFQRRSTWLTADSMNYLDKNNQQTTSSESSKDDKWRLVNEACLNELVKEAFLFDENKIDYYEEILDLLKLPQLKQLAKECHIKNVNQKITLKSDYVQLILNHFKQQKSLFSLKSFFVGQNTNDNQTTNPLFMKQCKKILGKCYTVNKSYGDVFVRILMLYSLSTTNHVDLANGKEMSQQLLQNLLMVRIGKVKFMDYVVNLTHRIYADRDDFINYQRALELKYELLNFIERKEYQEAFEKFNETHISKLKSMILNSHMNEYDANLPSYLRSYKSASICVRFLSIYADEVLQKLRKYVEANEIFEFLLNEQRMYALSSRAKWHERLALNYETHLSNPMRAFETIQQALTTDEHVKKAGRLNICQRLVKMSTTKRYIKLGDEFVESVKRLCDEEKYEFVEAPTVEIQGTILDADVIPGRKNIFIQNYQSSSSLKNDDDSNSSSNGSNSNNNVLIENRYNISVEQVALTHYIKNLQFTNGKHSETSVIMTIYGLIFWDIIFDTAVFNVFIDNFQLSPLDFASSHFYLNRKDKVEAKLAFIANATNELICEQMRDIWCKYNGIACSLVNWQLFDDMDEMIGLIKCFNSMQLKALCEYISKNYAHCKSGGPDLILWSTRSNKFKFVEVKGPGDRLSYKQKVWLDFFSTNSIECEVCHVKGKSNSKLFLSNNDD